MRQIVYLSCAGLLAASSGASWASDVSTWRWHVSQCLREQQAREAGAADIIREASAFEVAGMQQGQSSGASADPLYSSDLAAAAAAKRSGE